MDSGLLGIEEIDDQHAGIVAALGRLREATQRGVDWYTRHEEVVQLRELCAVHFRVEESLMRLHGCPGLEAHARDHRRFDRQLSDLAVRSVIMPLEPGTVDLLCAWWARHVSELDQAYIDWFARRPPVIGPPYSTTGAA